jgi:MSHA pilin protein MshC
MVQQQRGFTLIELISVMVLVGILSAVAFSRFADSSIYSQSLFISKIQSYLSLAQQLASAHQDNTNKALTSLSFTKTSDDNWQLQIQTINGSKIIDIASADQLTFDQTILAVNQRLSLFFNDNGDIIKQHYSPNDSAINADSGSVFVHSTALSVGSQILCIVPSGYSYKGQCE